MENKYTPGPWKLDAFRVSTINNDGIAQVLYNTPQAEANARLIAAAPDLLRASQDIIASNEFNTERWMAGHRAIQKALIPTEDDK